MLARFVGKPTTPKQIKSRRKARVDREGSPYFRHSFGVIANGGREHVEVATLGNGRAKAYEPLDFLQVVNNSDETVEIYVNGEFYQLSPSGSVITDDTTPGLWYVAIHNTDATSTSADEIKLLVRKQPLSADRLAREGR